MLYMPAHGITGTVARRSGLGCSCQLFAGYSLPNVAFAGISKRRYDNDVGFGRPLHRR